MRYRVTGLAGDSKGRAKRVLITTTSDRGEAIRKAREARSGFAQVRIEPVQGRKARGAMERLDDDVAARRSLERRKRRG